jgi:hypothetical protein
VSVNPGSYEGGSSHPSPFVIYCLDCAGATIGVADTMHDAEGLMAIHQIGVHGSMRTIIRPASAEAVLRREIAQGLA